MYASKDDSCMFLNAFIYAVVMRIVSSIFWHQITVKVSHESPLMTHSLCGRDMKTKMCLC